MILKNILIHIGFICSMTGIIAKILDWYNPYMDFEGHIGFTQILLYIVVLVLPFAQIKRKGKRKSDKKRITETL